MITHTMLFTNRSLTLVDGRAPKKPGSFADVVKDLERMGYVIQSNQCKQSKAEVVFVKPETEIDELLIALQSHDWTYMYSDSWMVAKAGQAEADRIRDLVKKTGEQGFQLTKNYIEERFPNGGVCDPESFRPK